MTITYKTGFVCGAQNQPPYRLLENEAGPHAIRILR
jgi:hypothetical protein